MIYVIDLFCGAGGMTTGIEAARVDGKKVAKVIACVNHDPYAIKSHKLNHKRVWHFIEDIRTLEIGPLAAMVRTLRKREPGCIIVLHASTECTHYSISKGGVSKDEDSRTLYQHIDRYVIAIQPDVVSIENVTEFRTAGPLRLKASKTNEFYSTLATDKQGNYIFIPNKERSGEGFKAWIKQLCAFGYNYEDRDLNSADFGQGTRRVRYFGQFVKRGLPIAWPTPTHAKKPETGSGLKQWRPVKDFLDLSNTGKSIFGRKKKLVDKSLERIYKGLVRYVAGGKEAFSAQKERYYNQNYFDGVKFIINDNPPMLNEGAFIQKYYTSGGNTSSISQPLGALTTKDRDAIVSCINSMDLINESISEDGNIVINESDSPVEILIKEFMAIYGIGDIHMRMMEVSEMKVIQGFPKNYHLAGNSTRQKKAIGNSVAPKVPKAMLSAMAAQFNQFKNGSLMLEAA